MSNSGQEIQRCNPPAKSSSAEILRQREDKHHPPECVVDADSTTSDHWKHNGMCSQLRPPSPKPSSPPLPMNAPSVHTFSGPCLGTWFHTQLRFSSTQGKTNAWNCSAFSSSPQGKPTNPIWAVRQPRVPPPSAEEAQGRLRAELRAQRQEISTGLRMSEGKRVKQPDLPLEIHTVQFCF